MMPIINTIRRCIHDESGVTAIEYGLIAALIALGIIGGVTAIGGKLTTAFQNINAALP